MKLRIHSALIAAGLLAACGSETAYPIGVYPNDVADLNDGAGVDIDVNSDVDLDLGSDVSPDVPDTTGDLVDDSGDATEIGEDAETDTTTSVCGDSLIAIGEACDGANLGGQTCELRGFSGGDLACSADCGSFDTSSCAGECVPACGGRECGADPVCGASCGACTGGEVCSAAGQCEPPGPVCGNDMREPGELCDAADLGTASCTDFGFERGTLACAADCLGFSFGACETDNPQPAVCGNAVREAGELCDAADVGTASCTDFGFDSGVLACASTCQAYTFGSCVNECEPACGGRECGLDPVCGTSCGTCGGGELCSAAGECLPPAPVCGDGVVGAGEACDPPDYNDQSCLSLGYDRGALSCSADCRTVVTSACESDCEPSCGARRCGPDPVCGISCGTCPSGDSCDASGACVSACVPNCGGRTCGLDPVCGTSCGTCGPGFSCTTAGTCQAEGPRGPVFIRFSTNVRDVTEGESVQFTAVVTDPDGIDDLIGGTLLDPVSGGVYGSFATSAAEGSYSLELTWNQIHRVRGIDFTSEQAREFEAEFFDVSGNRASQRVTVTLTCDGIAACSGVCTDLSTPSNCGTCGNRCDSGGICNGGVCDCPAGQDDCGGNLCVSINTTTNCGGCGIACDLGQVCEGGDCVCPEGYIYCDGECVWEGSNENCGVCGNNCGFDGYCDNGIACVCGPVGRACNGSCGSVFNVNTCGADCEVCSDAETCDGERCIPATEGSFRTAPWGDSQVLIDGIWTGICDQGIGTNILEEFCASLDAQFIDWYSDLYSSANGATNLTATCDDATLACEAQDLSMFGCSVTDYTAVICDLPPARGVVINEVFYDPAGAESTNDLEFVEIHGPAGYDLTGMSLVFYNSSGTNYTTWALGGTIPASGYFVVGGFSVAGANWLAATSLRNGPDSVRLELAGEVVDAVAYGTFSNPGFARGEGSPAPDAPDGSSIQRRAGNQDTGDNSSDFEIVTPSPGSASSGGSWTFPRSGSGSIDIFDPTFSRANEDCSGVLSGAYYYETVSITNPTDTDTTFTMTVGWADADGHLLVYGAFNPTVPLSECYGGDDDFGGTDASQVTGWIIYAGQTMVFVFTTYEPGQSTAYTWEMTSP